MELSLRNARKKKGFGLFPKFMLSLDIFIVKYVIQPTTEYYDK
jgi:hypothetical protein